MNVKNAIEHLDQFELITSDQVVYLKKYYGKVKADNSVLLIIQQYDEGKLDAITCFEFMSESIENIASYNNSFEAIYDGDDELISLEMVLYAVKHYDFEKYYKSYTSKEEIQTSENEFKSVFKDIDAAKLVFDYILQAQ